MSRERETDPAAERGVKVGFETGDGVTRDVQELTHPRADSGSVRCRQTLNTVLAPPSAIFYLTHRYVSTSLANGMPEPFAGPSPATAQPKTFSTPNGAVQFGAP